jgi:hypothetical protein
MTKTPLYAALWLLALGAMISIAAGAQNGPEFSLALSPAIVTLPQGAVTSFNLTIDGNEQPSYAVTLSGLPEGVLAQTPKVRAGMGVVVLFATPEAAIGTYAIQVTVRAGKNLQTQILTLNVRPMQPVPQWEYTVLTAMTDGEFISLANSLGDQGWELVNVQFREASVPPFVGFLKRIKR